MHIVEVLNIQQAFYGSFIRWSGQSSFILRFNQPNTVNIIMANAPIRITAPNGFVMMVIGKRLHNNNNILPDIEFTV